MNEFEEIIEVDAPLNREGHPGRVGWGLKRVVKESAYRKRKKWGMNAKPKWYRQLKGGRKKGA
jgi:hypothetical protein